MEEPDEPPRWRQKSPLGKGWKALIAFFRGRRSGDWGEIFQHIKKLEREGGRAEHKLWQLVRGALNLDEVQVRDIMISRSQIVSFHVGQSEREVLEGVVQSGHSRFPVFDEEEEKVLGIFYAKDLLGSSLKSAMGNGSKVAGDSILNPSKLRKPYLVPESKKALVLMEEFRATRNHMALVLDEFGVVGGLATIEDVIEEIVGEIEDEHDPTGVRTFTQEVAEGTAYLVRADMPLEEFNRQFTTTFDGRTAETIGGVLLRAFGRLPKTSDTISLEGLQFVVEQADRRRLKILRVAKIS